MRLSANFLRPERRSTGGQVILKPTSGRSENRPDLLFCGWSPLRNRTVDLLLTMHTSLGSLPGKHFPAGRRQVPIWLLPPPAAPAIAQPIAPAVVGTGPCPACAASARGWPAIQARPVGLHAGQPRPGRRSTDGQTNFPIPPAQGPKAALSRRFPTARGKLNHCPYLHLAGSHRRQPRSIAEPNDTRPSQIRALTWPNSGPSRRSSLETINIAEPQLSPLSYIEESASGARCPARHEGLTHPSCLRPRTPCVTICCTLS